MTKNRLDRRVQKTHQLLQEALVALVAEKGYETVTVQEILARANVGRSTFYAHFQDKDQLLHSCFDSLNGLFEQHTKRLARAEQTPEGDDNAAPTLSLFQFVGQNHRFFKALLGKRGNGIFHKPIYDYMLAHMNDHLLLLMPHENDDPFRREIVAHYLVSAMMGILGWWVEKDMPCAAEVIDKLLKQLALPTIRNVVGTSMSGTL